jgi:hypothetical protein
MQVTRFVRASTNLGPDVKHEHHGESKNPRPEHLARARQVGLNLERLFDRLELTGSEGKRNHQCQRNGRDQKWQAKILEKITNQNRTENRADTPSGIDQTDHRRASSAETAGEERVEIQDAATVPKTGQEGASQQYSPIWREAQAERTEGQTRACDQEGIGFGQDFLERSVRQNHQEVANKKRTEQQVRRADIKVETRANREQGWAEHRLQHAHQDEGYEASERQTER